MEQNSKHTPDLKYSPHYKDEPQGHLWSYKEDRMVCHLTTVAAGTQKQLDKDAARIVEGWNGYSALLQENKELKKALKRIHRLLEQEETVSNMQDIIEETLNNASH